MNQIHALLLFAALVLAGCASRPINQPITQADPQAGYRPYLLLPKRLNNDPHTLFVLSFSGGGTRAAAFSYGVLEELRRTDIEVNGQQRRLIDEVDVITGVSGGSFTALAYALHGERLFAEYEQRFLKRVDGGVSDNIGVRGVLEAIEELAMSAEFRGQVGFGAIRRVIIIVVNSHSSPSTDWDRNEAPPGMVAQLMQSAGVPIDRYSFETVETMKDLAQIQEWRRELKIAEARLAGASKEEAEAGVPKVDFEVLDVSFDAIRDPQEREYFMNLPTSFVLPDEAVDRLREVAGKLLQQSSEYQAVVGDLGGKPPTKPIARR